MMKNLAIHRLAVSKVQIKLNNLINNHKASLKLHDDIVDLFNEYISSPNFDLYATLKSRKTFIRSMESSYGVTKLQFVDFVGNHGREFVDFVGNHGDHEMWRK